MEGFFLFSAGRLHGRRESREVHVCRDDFSELPYKIVIITIMASYRADWMENTLIACR